MTLYGGEFGDKVFGSGLLFDIRSLSHRSLALAGAFSTETCFDDA